MVVVLLFKSPFSVFCSLLTGYLWWGHFGTFSVKQTGIWESRIVQWGAQIHIVEENNNLPCGEVMSRSTFNCWFSLSPLRWVGLNVRAQFGKWKSWGLLNFLRRNLLGSRTCSPLTPGFAILVSSRPLARFVSSDPWKLPTSETDIHPLQGFRNGATGGKQSKSENRHGFSEEYGPFAGVSTKK